MVRSCTWTRSSVCRRHTELSVADVDGDDLPGPATEQDVGEAAGRRAGVQAAAAVDDDVRERIEGTDQFVRAAGGPSRVGDVVPDQQRRAGVDRGRGLGGDLAGDRAPGRRRSAPPPARGTGPGRAEPARRPAGSYAPGRPGTGRPPGCPVASAVRASASHERVVRCGRTPATWSCVVSRSSPVSSASTPVRADRRPARRDRARAMRLVHRPCPPGGCGGPCRWSNRTSPGPVCGPAAAGTSDGPARLQSSDVRRNIRLTGTAVGRTGSAAPGQRGRGDRVLRPDSGEAGCPGRGGEHGQRPQRAGVGDRAVDRPVRRSDQARRVAGRPTIPGCSGSTTGRRDADGVILLDQPAQVERQVGRALPGIGGQQIGGRGDAGEDQQARRARPRPRRRCRCPAGRRPPAVAGCRPAGRRRRAAGVPACRPPVGCSPVAATSAATIAPLPGNRPRSVGRVLSTLQATQSAPARSAMHASASSRQPVSGEWPWTTAAGSSAASRTGIEPRRWSPTRRATARRRPAPWCRPDAGRRA